jgi:hypothetical protein
MDALVLVVFILEKHPLSQRAEPPLGLHRVGLFAGAACCDVLWPGGTIERMHGVVGSRAKAAPLQAADFEASGLTTPSHFKREDKNEEELPTSVFGLSRLPRLAEPSRDIILGLLLNRIGKQLLCPIELDQAAEIKEGCEIRTASRLLHVVRHDNDRKLVF